MTDLTTFLASLRHEATMAERKDEWARKIPIDPAVALALLDVVEAAHRLNTVKEGFQLAVAAGDLSHAIDRLSNLASKP